MNNVYVYIFSWKRITDNSVNLFNKVSEYFPNTYMINCNENITLPINPKFNIQLDDSYYYGGQFDTAIKHAPEGSIVGFITGDVDPNADWDKILNNMKTSFATNKIGIYAPNVDFTAHTNRGNYLWDSLYEVPNTDCTCWFIHPMIIKKLLPIPYFKLSNLGWGIDIIFIEECKKNNLHVARDYSVIVYQPRCTAYNMNEAGVEQNILINYYNKNF
jgi:hypothetical protein